MKSYATLVTSKFCERSVFHSEDPILEDSNFRSMIGALNFLARRTRPNTETAVEILSPFSTMSTNFVFHDINSLLGYLNSACDFTLVITFSSRKNKLKIYFNFDFSTERAD